MVSIYLGSFSRTHSLQSNSPTMVSSSSRCTSKDRAVAQSHEASRQKRVSASFQCPYVGLQERVWLRFKAVSLQQGAWSRLKPVSLLQGTWPRLKQSDTVTLIPNDHELGDLLVLIFWNSQTACFKISSPRSRSETCISEPPD